MSSFLLHSLCVALSLTTAAHAQTSTSCNPLLKSCPPNKALSSTTYTHDFTQGADPTNWNTTHGTVAYTPSGAEFTVSKSGDAPTLASTWYILFGRVSFHIRAAPGTGIVSSAILQSDDLDEIDWEWVGGNPAQTQSNYFGKGNTTTYDRAQWVPSVDTQASVRNYTITWSSSATTWYIDDTPIRTLAYADAVGGKNYPQTPMNVRVGIWAGGDPGNDEGTIEWSGGLTDFEKGPYKMVLEKIEVENWSPGGSYVYGDMSGSWESIRVDGEGKEGSGVVSKASTMMSTASTSVTMGVSKATGAAGGVGSGSGTETVASASVTATPESALHNTQENMAMCRGTLGLWKLGVVLLMSLM